MSECVKVVVRARPMNKKETDNGSKCCLVFKEAAKQIQITNLNEKGS
jgi:hypothetical protein